MPTLDVVLFGATGFTGRQAAMLLSTSLPSTMRFGLAARDGTRLDRVARELPRPPDATFAVTADDKQGLLAITKEARVVISTAGPFARLGDTLVDQCVEARTDYADITGETPWVARVIGRHHERAQAAGIRLVPFSGFDSVPSDLSVFLIVQALQALGEEVVDVRSSVAGRGGLNGGTLASALALAEDEDPRVVGDRFLLTPGPLKARAGVPRGFRTRAFFDPVVGKRTAPFFMAPVNERVVHRSAALFDERGAGYGARFNYQENTHVGRDRFGVKATATALLTTAFFASTGFSPGRALLRAVGPKPGEGPSETAMDQGFTRLSLVARAASGRRATGRFVATGDPGNRVTVRILVETARALRETADRQAAGAGGVLTPAVALGSVLVDRLRAVGMEISAEAGEAVL